MTTQVTITAKLAGRVVQVKAAGQPRQFITPDKSSVTINLSDQIVTLTEGATFADHATELAGNLNAPKAAAAKPAKKAKR